MALIKFLFKKFIMSKAKDTVPQNREGFLIREFSVILIGQV